MRSVAGTGAIVLPSTGAKLLAYAGVPVAGLVPGSVLLDIRPESGAPELRADGTWVAPTVVCVDDPQGPVADDALLFGGPAEPIQAADLAEVRAAAIVEVRRIEETRWTFTDASSRVWDLSTRGRLRLFTVEHHDQVTPGSGFPRTILSANGVSVAVPGRTAYNALMSPITGAMVARDEATNAAEVSVRLASDAGAVVGALLAYRSA